MKNNLFLIGLFAVGSLFLNGCNQDDNDDDNNDAPNGFTYDGTFYDAELFGIYTFQQGTYDLRIELSTGAGWNSNDQQVTGGPFTMLRLNAITYQDGNTPGAGTYTFSQSATTPGTISADTESFWLNFDYSTLTSDPSPNVVGGNLEISVDGSEFTLDYTLTMSDGKTITGHYKGERDYLYMT